MDMILGLTPTHSVQTNALIELALELSQSIGIPTEYRIRKNGTCSWPHLSLFQFDLLKETHAYQQELYQFWNEVLPLWQNPNHLAPINSLKFLSVHPYIEYKEKSPDPLKKVTWAQLKLNKSIPSRLQPLHEKILNLSALFPFQNAMSEYGRHYHPHITLFSILNTLDSIPLSVSKLNKKYRAILCQPFEVQLILGSGNAFGELTTILFASDHIPS